MDEIRGVEPRPAEELEGLLPLQQQVLMNDRRRDAFKGWKRDELVDELLANNIAVEAVITMEEALARPHPQLDANDMAEAGDDPPLGPPVQGGAPLNPSRTPGKVRGPP